MAHIARRINYDHKRITAALVGGTVKPLTMFVLWDAGTMCHVPCVYVFVCSCLCVRDHVPPAPPTLPTAVSLAVPTTTGLARVLAAGGTTLSVAVTPHGNRGGQPGVPSMLSIQRLFTVLSPPLMALRLRGAAQQQGQPYQPFVPGGLLVLFAVMVAVCVVVYEKLA